MNESINETNSCEHKILIPVEAYYSIYRAYGGSWDIIVIKIDILFFGP